MGLEVRRVDHDPVGLSGTSGQFGKDPVEHPEPAPAHEPVVDRLVWPITFGRIAPHQSMLDDIDDAGNDPPVINPRDTMRKREKRLDPAHLLFIQQERNIHNQRLLDADLESVNHRPRKAI